MVRSKPNARAQLDMNLTREANLILQFSNENLTDHVQLEIRESRNFSHATVVATYSNYIVM